MYRTIEKVVLSAALLFFIAAELEARPFRVNQVPNGNVNSCMTCHTSNNGGARNVFGQMVGSSFLDGSGNVIWNSNLAMADADGDGFSNGHELQDPFGTWTGGTNPGMGNFVSAPGNSMDTPAMDGEKYSISIDFTAFAPHVGQKMELRVLDLVSWREVVRTGLDAIDAADFNVTLLNVLDEGGDYWVEFYADLNGNGEYDAPPVDHAWRLPVLDVMENVSASVGHSTDFADIAWTEALTLNFAGFTPHIGQQMGIRVYNSDNWMEVDRIVLDAVPGDAFQLDLTGLEIGENYWLDLYADLNGNGLYDTPGNDHAWRVDLGTISGDLSVDINHNTNFTDISWPYMVALKFTDMTPHVGQMLEARMVDQQSGEILYSNSIAAILNDAFTLYFPAGTLGGNYDLEFYADLNMNGSYDAPPTDHAWRVSSNDLAGDSEVMFAHNTDFVDLDWLLVSVKNLAQVPDDFAISGNFPNPFNPTTTIRYNLNEAAEVQLTIYDIQGRMVRSLVQSSLSAGSYQAAWDGMDDTANPVPAGVYLVRLQSPQNATTHRMLLLK